MHDQNCTGARKGDTEAYNCEEHVLGMKVQNHLKTDQVSLKVYTRKSKHAGDGVELISHLFGLKCFYLRRLNVIIVMGT